VKAAGFAQMRLYLPMRPAEAEITGAGLQWTAAMISLVSIPCM
jgi:hypothetical protein